jgi:membrane-bound lytic murein transglycosylase MltF
MEMLNAGLLQAIVVDDWKAKMWAGVFKRIELHPNIVLRPATRRGWAIRKGNPKLAAALNDFYASWAKKEAARSQRHAAVQKASTTLRNPGDGDDWRRFEQLLRLFERYGRRYGFEPLMLAALGYQESMLDQRKISRAGAVGVMQLMPATAASLHVGNVAVTEMNIHAGAKYLDQLLDTYFAGAHFSDEERPLFAFAAYNAGPAKIVAARDEARTRGLDPDKWFNNVEVVAADKLGSPLTNYVRNIYKYYAAYRLMLGLRDSTPPMQSAQATN